MKKTLSLLLVLSIMCSFPACSFSITIGHPTDPSNPSQPAPSNADPAEAPTDSTKDTQPTEEPTTSSNPGSSSAAPIVPSPSHPTSLEQLKTLVNNISGKWYLAGYADVYLDIAYEPNDSIYSAYMWLTSKNFSLKDNGASLDGSSVLNTYTVYPHIQCPEGTMWTAGKMYSLIRWNAVLSEDNIEINDDCIYMGTYKFIRLQGEKNQHSEFGALGEGMEHDYETKVIDATPTTYGYTLYVCKVCGFSYEDNHFNWDEPLVTEPSTTDPPATEPSTTEPPIIDPPATEPSSDVLIISDFQIISNQTINTDVYITSTGVATFINVTVNGNIYCYGKLTVSEGHTNNLYAYYWDLGGIKSWCEAWDGTHGLVEGSFRTCGSVIIKDYALDYAFEKWGRR